VVCPYVHESERYQGTWSPDIDNILKPLLDGMSGPQGLLVNDCQAQSVRCSWIDSPTLDHRLQFELRFSPDEWIRKDGLIWIEFRRKLCLPLSTQIPRANLLKLLRFRDPREAGGRWGLRTRSLCVYGADTLS
jgi:hypothetical protein